MAEKSLKIRVAATSDKAVLLSIARLQHSKSIFNNVDFCREKFDRIFNDAFSGIDHHCCIVAELGPDIVGGLFASAGEYRLGKGELLTTIHALAVDSRKTLPALRVKVFAGLVKGAREWSRNRGVSRIVFSVTTGTQLRETHELLQRLGGQPIGCNFILPTELDD